MFSLYSLTVQTCISFTVSSPGSQLHWHSKPKTNERIQNIRDVPDSTFAGLRIPHFAYQITHFILVSTVKCHVTPTLILTLSFTIILYYFPKYKGVTMCTVSWEFILTCIRSDGISFWCDVPDAACVCTIVWCVYNSVMKKILTNIQVRILATFLIMFLCFFWRIFVAGFW